MAALKEKSGSESTRRENLLQAMGVKVAEGEALKKEAEEKVRIEKWYEVQEMLNVLYQELLYCIVARSDGVRRCSCHTNGQGVDAAFVWRRRQERRHGVVSGAVVTPSPPRVICRRR